VEVAVSLVFTVIDISRMSSLCFGGQRVTAVDWMGELEVAMYFVLMLSTSLRMMKIDQNMGL
jgi:predicted membrane-bound spermidine synthase